MSVVTRAPSGRVPWPLVLAEGDEHGGALEAALRLSASPHVGRTFVVDLDRWSGAVDQFAELGPYEIVDTERLQHDQLIDLVKVLCREPWIDGCPNVIVLNAASLMWTVLRERAAGRARLSLEAKQLLARDPNATIKIPHHLWDEVHSDWAAVTTPLRVFPGVGVLVASGYETESGYEVDGDHGVGRMAHAWVRCRRGRKPQLVAAQTLAEPTPDGLIFEDNPLEHVVFTVLGATTATSDNPENGCTAGGTGPDGDGQPDGVDDEPPSSSTPPANEAAA